MGRSTDGWHGWFPALQDEKPYRKAIALDSEPFPSVSASYFDLVRDPKTGEITFWTKEDDTEGTAWRHRRSATRPPQTRSSMATCRPHPRSWMPRMTRPLGFSRATGPRMCGSARAAI